MARVNETRFLVQHESCECKCRLNENGIVVIVDVNVRKSL